MNETISWVRSAELNDNRTIELLRRELSDLMHSRGWDIKSICEAFNARREALNSNAVHYNNIKSALYGKKSQRSLAFEIEQFMITNSGPLKNEMEVLKAIKSLSSSNIPSSSIAM